MSKQSKDYLDELEQKELKFKYNSAYDKLSTYLGVLISNYEKDNGGVSTVVHATGRIKNFDSAITKLIKKKYEVSAAEMEKRIGDMVGVRFVCPFIGDVYELVDLIKSSNVIKVYKEKDFIKNPKESGYRSYHILAEVTVPYGDGEVPVKCEIQVRSSIMDSWAVMEHAIKYKPKGSRKLTERQKEMLITCAKATRAIEESMTNLRLKNQEADNSLKNDIDISKYFVSEDDLKEYQDATKILSTLLNCEIENYNLSNSTKLVEHSNSRLKKASSIYRKLSEKGLEVNIDNIKNNIYDIAAVRYVCRSVDDVYDMVNLIQSMDSIKIHEVKDYIKNPKESGYRGYHLIVDVPVPKGDGVEYVKAEIQLRTSLMHSWAVMEDLIKYHKDYEYTEVEKMMLKLYADSLSEIDDFMGGFFKPDSAKTKHILEEYFSPYDEEKPKCFVRK